MYSAGSLKVDGIAISLDDAASDVCFVSHAHTDHTEAFRKKGKVIIASEETFALVGKEPHSHPVPRQVSLHPAGHMLGARQLLAETEAGKFVYTGDFALHDSYTAKAAPVLQCDTLMIDSTYCLPHLRFPKRERVLSDMQKFVRQNERSIIVFGAYTRGKTQELVRFLNTECGVAPVVNEPAGKICAIYEKCGVKLDYIASGTDDAEEAMRSSFVAIMPPQMVNFQFGANLADAFGRDVKTAVATGWAAISRFPTDASFPLSDHADFRDTMGYIYGSGAKKVICANSAEEESAAYLRSLGIDAVAKEEAGKSFQTTLAKG